MGIGERVKEAAVIADQSSEKEIKNHLIENTPVKS